MASKNDADLASKIKRINEGEGNKCNGIGEGLRWDTRKKSRVSKGTIT